MLRINSEGRRGITFQRGTYRFPAFSMHALELFQLTLEGSVSFISGARNALRRWFVGGSMIRLGIRARPFKSASEILNGVDDRNTVAHQARRMVWLL